MPGRRQLAINLRPHLQSDLVQLKVLVYYDSKKYIGDTHLIA